MKIQNLIPIDGNITIKSILERETKLEEKADDQGITKLEKAELELINFVICSINIVDENVDVIDTDTLEYIITEHKG